MHLSASAVVAVARVNGIYDDGLGALKAADHLYTCAMK